MKNRCFTLSASIAAALAGSMSAHAGTANANALAGIDTAESPRVTQVVNANALSTVTNTHLALLSNLTPTSTVGDATPIKHLQLVLQPSAARKAQLVTLIGQQHDANSPHFHQWLTPEQYGQAFGVVDSDIAAVTSWLQSQGFTVNGVYPNKTEVDFSGTAGQVKLAFHTQEAHYQINGKDEIANTTDISVPTALQPVIAGVLGLNTLRPTPQHVPVKTSQFDPSTHRFASKGEKVDALKSVSMAVPFTGGARGLVPNDFANMYGIVGAAGQNIRANGVTGKGITIALVEDTDMVPSDWANFVSQFNLGSYGGTFTQFMPNAGGITNCYDEDTLYHFQDDDIEALMDAEYATAMAPGANVEVATCTGYNLSWSETTDNYFGGVFLAANNLINSESRPDIISASYGYGEDAVDSASKQAIDLMWAQADAEGISVFVASGDSGSNPDFNGRVINQAGISVNALASSTNATAVGGTDTADVLDGTTSKYFRSTPNAAYGTAMGYVPEIPWNESCGNGVAAQAAGFASALDFCVSNLGWDPDGHYLTSEGSGGGPSAIDAKPVWQRQVYGAAADQSRDVPDVALFAGSYGGATWAVLCTHAYPCTPNFTTPVILEGGTSLASPLMAGIQALIDQGIAMRGLSADQGNAAPTLYALAAQEYGGANGTPPSSLEACASVDNGDPTTGSGCVFHNIIRGSISTNCVGFTIQGYYQYSPTPDCYYYGNTSSYPVNPYAKIYANIGLTSTNPNSYGPTVKAYSAQPGWSFASGLGSVNARNLLMAWRAFINAPAAAP